MLSTPLERDEGEYACVGQWILRGHAPYTVCYNMKLPGTYLAYAAIMGILGETDVAIHLGALLVNFAGVFLLYRLGRRFLGATGAATAAATHALLTLSPSVYGFAAHATQFVIVAALGGLLALCRAFEVNRRAWFCWSGFLFGAAFLMKQPGLLFGLFALMLIVIRATTEKAGSWRARLGPGGCFLMAAAAPLAVIVFWIWRAGALHRFWFWTFAYARDYGAQISGARAFALLSQYVGRNSDRWFWFGGPIAMIVVFAARKQGRWLGLGLFVFSAAAVAAGWRFTGHYFILLTPALGLFLGAAFEIWSAAPSSAFPWLAPAAFLALCGSVPFRHPLVLLHSTPDEAVVRRYPGNPFVESREIGRYLGAHSMPTDTIAVLGSEPEIFFYAQRRPASGYIYMYDLIALQPWAVEMQNDMISQIEQARPKFLVFVRDDPSWIGLPGAPRASDANLNKWALAFASSNYSPAGLVLVAPTPVYFWGTNAFRQPAAPPFISILQRNE